MSNPTDYKDTEIWLKDFDKKINKNIQNIYTQIESLFWLQQCLTLQRPLPPLRGWPTSPDFLLKLHSFVLKSKPKLIIETGSGASTLVIADALRQNGMGKLISLEHLQKYADKTYETLAVEGLTPWVELRVGALEPWRGEHLNPKDVDKPSRWYQLNLKGIDHIDLLVVDGPPGNTCLYARYPALPAFFDHLAPNAEVWMDDTNRQEEKEISEAWAKRYSLDLEFVPLEKGLSCLKRHSPEPPSAFPVTANRFSNDDHPESSLGLDFSLSDDTKPILL